MANYIFGKPINGIIHGGDYNPEQWLDCPDILEKVIVMPVKPNSRTI